MPSSRRVLVVLVALLGFARLAPAGGALDPAFGSGGILTIEAGAWGSRFVAHGGTGALDPANPDALVVAAVVPVASGIETYSAAVAADGALLHATSLGAGTIASSLTFSRLLVDPGDPAHRLYAVGSRYVDGGTPPYAFAVARLTPLGDGYDPAWNGGAALVTPIAGAAAPRPTAIALGPGGKLIVAGDADTGGGGVALARYDSGGALDPTFGTGGTAVLPGGIVRAVAVQDDGKVLLGGVFTDGPVMGFGVMRLLADGTLDPTFGASRGVAGVEITAFKARYTQGIAVGVAGLPDGRIVAAGGDWDPATERWAFAAARYLPDGTLDPSFARRGRLRKNVGRSSAGSAVAFLADGGLLLAGPARRGHSPHYPDIALLRLDADGAIDRTFGRRGKVQTPAAAESEGLAVHDVVVDALGRATVVATSADGSGKATLLARYLP